jgi:hypothetical protein
MTYQDPKIPDPELGRNPPQYRDLNIDSYSMGSFIALVVGIVLIGGVIFYATSEPLGTTASNPPPTTTGQGGAQVSPPTAPRMAPAAPSTTVPPIDQNVPAQKVAPPIPAEPRTTN